MTLNKYLTHFIFFIILTICACSGPESQISNLYDETFTETVDTICPQVRYIENLDTLKVGNNNQDTYTINFYETKWKCYTISIDNINLNYNVDLDIKFKVDYNEDIKIYKQEEFSFIVALVNEENDIIIKEKFTRNFKNTSNSSVISNQNNLININLIQTGKDLSSYQLLLGLIK